MTRRVTTDHDTIRRWIESRGGHPAAVRGAPGEETGALHVDIPGYDEQEFLAPLSWDEFFRRFEAKRLAFVYEDEGRFFQFVERSRA